MTHTAFTLALVVSGLVGCAGGAQSVPVENARNVAPQFASALDEAFARYETEVVRATQLSYDSPDEANAVARSLTAARFDQLLDEALARRGTNRTALGSYLGADARFATGQETLYQGRLERLEAQAQRIAHERGALVASN